MPRGGKRPGAGRKPGPDWASRKPTQVRAAARARLRVLLEEGRDPISVLMDVACDEALDVQVRVQAATAAAPYCYPRLSMAVVADATPRSERLDPSELLERLNARLAGLAPPLRTIEAVPEPLEVSAG